ncbi:Spermidine synthase [Oopsacas minuta]|uniref:Spermidine synthase n=1 Tax=Oopsacas minuta TaxID=111878 RepID=A0AAV7K9X0_9METZ|nr:Spermidine synthase [Oopsacas minuta]
MELIVDGWFHEKNSMWPHQATSLEVSEVLASEKSKYQDILLFKNQAFGTVLVLDGAIQLTEKDERVYNENIVHIPIMSHPNPKRVLIIGGGDGGALREAVKHPSVEEVVMCEIDERVIELSKKYLPGLSAGFSHPKAKVVIGDAVQYIKECADCSFDVIVSDTSDPVGPAEALFEKDHYTLLKRVLRPDGILCSQAGCIWFDLEIIQKMMKFSRELFPTVDYATFNVPTYPYGALGFLLCCKSNEINFKEPLRTLSHKDLDELDISVYSQEYHRGVFLTVPRYIKNAM